MSSFITEIAVYFMSNKEMSYLIMNMSMWPLILYSNRNVIIQLTFGCFSSDQHIKVSRKTTILRTALT